MVKEPLDNSPGCFGILLSAIGWLIRWTVAYFVFASLALTMYAAIRGLPVDVWVDGVPSEAIMLILAIMFMACLVPLTIVLGVIGDSSRVASGIAIAIFIGIGTVFQLYVWVWMGYEGLAVSAGLNTMFGVMMWLPRARLHRLIQKK